MISNCPICNSGRLDEIIKTDDEEGSPFYGRDVKIIVCKNEKKGCAYKHKELLDEN